MTLCATRLLETVSVPYTRKGMLGAAVEMCPGIVTRYYGSISIGGHEDVSLLHAGMVPSMKYDTIDMQ